MHVNPTDGLGRVTGFDDTNVNITNPELAGIDIVQSNITYGTIELGSVSSRQERTKG